MSNTEIIIKATAPQHQKVHIKLARMEIEQGIQNLNDAILNLILYNDNFRWEEKDKQELRDFIDRAKYKIDRLRGYFNLPE